VERRRAQEDRQMLWELGAKTEELERFGHTVSHALKTPLTAIRGFLRLMGKIDPVAEPERLQRYLGRAAEAAEHLAKRLTDLLELSRLGHLVRPEDQVAFAAVAREAVGMVEEACARRGIQVALAQSFPTVRGDRIRLREVLENLLDNAVKFMGNQPAPRVVVGVREEGPTPVFFVRDNGKGIAADDREKVFDLFTRLHPNAEGAGAGLAIVRRIVEAHGGRIWVESKGPGTGSTFCFTLGASGATGRGADVPA
jgi:signal transduction histidine kinase